MRCVCVCGEAKQTQREDLSGPGAGGAGGAGEARAVVCGGAGAGLPLGGGARGRAEGAEGVVGSGAGAGHVGGVCGARHAGGACQRGAAEEGGGDEVVGRALRGGARVAACVEIEYVALDAAVDAAARAGGAACVGGRGVVEPFLRMCRVCLAHVCLALVFSARVCVCCAYHVQRSRCARAREADGRGVRGGARGEILWLPGPPAPRHVCAHTGCMGGVGGKRERTCDVSQSASTVQGRQSRAWTVSGAPRLNPGAQTNSQRTGS